MHNHNNNCPTQHILSEDVFGDLECLYKACQAGGLFKDTGVNERGENERQSELITVRSKPI